MSNLLKKDKGFTLIEIVLALAIAGLLLVIIFLAVQGANKSRRDSQRKNDVAAVLANTEQYASNNAGAYPASQALFNTNFGAGGTYHDAARLDPLQGGVYTYNGLVAPTNAVAAGIAYTNPSARQVRLCIGTEQGGQFCVQN